MKPEQKIVKEKLASGRTIFHVVDALPKWRPAFQDEEYMMKAKIFRHSQVVIYPDTMELTEESKAMLRRKR